MKLVELKTVDGDTVFMNPSHIVLVRQPKHYEKGKYSEVHFNIGGANSVLLVYGSVISIANTIERSME